MRLYAGMDLHSSNTYLGIMEVGSMKRVYNKRIHNNLPAILSELEPFRNMLEGIAIESTYNWCWLFKSRYLAPYTLQT
jgi:transposase